MIAISTVTFYFIDLEVQHLKQVLTVYVAETLANEQTQLFDDLNSLRGVNVDYKRTLNALLMRIQNLADKAWFDRKVIWQLLLNDDERLNLSVRCVTLNTQKRQIINDYMVSTLDMLEQLPFSKHLQCVPEYDGCNHEGMDSKCYPIGLVCEQMSISARIMCTTDVLEALAAKELPSRG